MVAQIAPRKPRSKGAPEKGGIVEPFTYLASGGTWHHFGCILLLKAVRIPQDRGPTSL